MTELIVVFNLKELVDSTGLFVSSRFGFGINVKLRHIFQGLLTTATKAGKLERHFGYNSKHEVVAHYHGPAEVFEQLKAEAIARHAKVAE